MTAPTTLVQALPSEMKAQFLEAFNTPYVLRTVPLPVPTHPHDVLIKVDAASYCHTDAVLAAGLMPPNPPHFPHVGSHEFAGTVVALPPSSSSSSPSPWQVGDRVGVPGRSFHPCGACFECARGPSPQDPDADEPGYSVYCPRSLNNGISGPGGFREYAVVDGRQLAPVPDGMAAVDAAVLMCAGVTVYAALKRCRLERGQRVGVVGCGGGLGHLGMQFAVGMGFRVTGVDAADAPLRLARSVVEGGKARIVDARVDKAGDVVARMGEEDGKTDVGDMGLDAVIILPESQKAFDYGVGLLRNHGTCVVVSFPAEGFHFSARDVVFRDISIVGSLVGSNKLLREMLQFAARHGVRAKIKTFPLSGLNDLVSEYNKGEGGKLVVDMSLTDGV
ncbi:alcohol dehydrogenase-like protein [Coniochaeta ligniaria NRRL 30616]|uniref:Alcohol dehydrogenase-like protein n=1 Tax=Coniochaeta ligniaria NRRL 30616 TaxID=1408157 RepID=A0A1J7JID1_9PEZI|nr:alcohol dehydrogenase-like protein [Coniochaeta ligniaria NRRL 30616]